MDDVLTRSALLLYRYPVVSGSHFRSKLSVEMPAQTLHMQHLKHPERRPSPPSKGPRPANVLRRIP